MMVPRHLILVVLVAVAFAACGGAPGPDDEVFEEPAKEIEEVEGEQVPDEAPAATDTPTQSPPTEAPGQPLTAGDSNLATTVINAYADTTEDCMSFAGGLTDCLGNDIEAVLMALISTNHDLALFLIEAEAGGFAVPQTQITLTLPFIIGSIKFHDFDPGRGYICFNWSNPITLAPPSDPAADVYGSCFVPMRGQIYTNNITADGQRTIEVSPTDTFAYTDLETGFTLAQELRRIYAQEPLTPLNVVAIDNENTFLDEMPVDTLSGFLSLEGE